MGVGCVLKHGVQQMIRDNFGKFGRWIDAQSPVRRVGVLVGAVVLFMVGQQFAALSNAAEGTAGVMAFWAIIAIGCAIVALYAIYAVIRAFLGRGPTTATDTAD